MRSQLGARQVPGQPPQDLEGNSKGQGACTDIRPRVNPWPRVRQFHGHLIKRAHSRVDGNRRGGTLPHPMGHPLGDPPHNPPHQRTIRSRARAPHGPDLVGILHRPPLRLRGPQPRDAAQLPPDHRRADRGAPVRPALRAPEAQPPAGDRAAHCRGRVRVPLPAGARVLHNVDAGARPERVALLPALLRTGHARGPVLATG